MPSVLTWTLPTVYVIGSVMVYMRMATDVCAMIAQPALMTADSKTNGNGPVFARDGETPDPPGHSCYRIFETLLHCSAGNVRRKPEYHQDKRPRIGG